MAVLDTLPKGIPDDHGIPTLGWGLLAWAAPLFIQTNGPKQGLPFQPTIRQGRFLLWWYALDRDTGEFLYRHAVRRLAKGSGKSPFAGFVALCELLGPVRFDYWDSSVDGGAVGKSVGMSLVQIAATSEAQTKNTMRHIRQFAAKERKLAKTFRLNTGKTQIAVMGTGAELQAMTASATGAEGAEPSCVVSDETEHWYPSNNGDDLYYTLDRNLAKSNSRMIETCNAWEPGAGSMAEMVWDAYVLQQEAIDRGENPDGGLILYDCIEAPDDTDLADEQSLISALEAVYADCEWVNPRGIAETIWSRRTRPEVARRFYLNQRVANAKAWTTPTAWGAIANPAHVVPYGAEIVAFFDGSKSDDATALVGCELETGHVFEFKVWEPGDGEEIDVADVDREVRLMFENYSVAAFHADVAEWESFVKITWAEQFGSGLRYWADRNATPAQPIAWDMRAKKREFAIAAEQVASEIENQKFTHDGSSVMTRHVLNMQLRAYQKWNSVGKGDRSRKIDAGVCVIGARMLRQFVLSGKTETKKKTGSFRATRRW